MVYVSLSCHKLRRNPFHRAKFYLWATRRVLRAERASIFVATNSVGGRFFTMTVWEDPSELLEFETGSGVNAAAAATDVTTTAWTTRKASTKQAPAVVHYSYETKTVPSWDEAIDMLEKAEASQ